MKIPNDQATFDACEAVMSTWEDGPYRRFALKGRTDIISAEIFQTSILLAPERSSGHKAVVSALGLNEG